MPTRFYLSSAASVGVFPTVDSAWERVSSTFVRGSMLQRTRRHGRAMHRAIRKHRIRLSPRKMALLHLLGLKPR